MIECGIQFKKIRQAFDFGLSNVAACLITHEHKDHCKAVKDLMSAGVDCYMSPGTAKALKLSGHRIKEVEPLKTFSVGSWKIMPFDTQHDCAQPYGFLLANQDRDKMLFATDTYYIKYRFKGLTHIVIECNYILNILEKNIEAGLCHASIKNRILESHFELENLKEFFRANDMSKVEQIHLIHISSGNGDSGLFKQEIQGITGKPVYIEGVL
jgi:phosphoribosyl 1,2-cyclic phosphodiesterase